MSGPGEAAENKISTGAVRDEGPALRETSLRSQGTAERFRQMKQVETIRTLAKGADIQRPTNYSLAA